MTTNKIIILGSGASPGVPSLSKGWGDCNPDNPKNTRSRTDVYIEYKGVKILIDTSPDLRRHLLDNDIRELDGVLYTHYHADHIHGIDDLREINRISRQSLNIYADSNTFNYINENLSYLVSCQGEFNPSCRPNLTPNLVKHNEPFYIKDVKITPIKLIDHLIPSTGYVFDDGEIVYIADFKSIAPESMPIIIKQPKIMVMPLTTPKECDYHASLEEILQYNEIIKPTTLIVNHMSTECDYDKINNSTPDNVLPAWDGMKVEF